MENYRRWWGWSAAFGILLRTMWEGTEIFLKQEAAPRSEFHERKPLCCKEQAKGNVFQLKRPELLLMPADLTRGQQATQSVMKGKGKTAITNSVFMQVSQMKRQCQGDRRLPPSCRHVTAWWGSRMSAGVCDVEMRRENHKRLKRFFNQRNKDERAQGIISAAVEGKGACSDNEDFVRIR